jgi:hypothetical protein
VKWIHENVIFGNQFSGFFDLIHSMTVKIPHAYERIKCWYYLDRFPTVILKLESAMDSIDDACQVSNFKIMFLFLFC